jgi:hypothetical protein
MSDGKFTLLVIILVLGFGGVFPIIWAWLPAILGTLLVLGALWFVGWFLLWSVERLVELALHGPRRQQLERHRDRP